MSSPAFTVPLVLAAARPHTAALHSRRPSLASSARPTPRPTPRMTLSERKTPSDTLTNTPVAKPTESSTPTPITPVAPISGEEAATPIRISGNNISLTDSLRAHIEEKLSKTVRRYEGLLTKLDVHLTVEHNPSIRDGHKAEVVAFVGKTILRNEVRASDMYEAIDSVHQRFSRTIRKYKERRVSTVARDHPSKTSRLAAVPGVAMPNDVFDEASAQAPYEDVYASKELAPGVPAVDDVVRRKVFPMPLQSVEEAVLCCEYVDHPWYLFRNAESGDICLVYKRNHGGYGLIEPSNPDSVDDEQVI